MLIALRFIPAPQAAAQDAQILAVIAAALPDVLLMEPHPQRLALHPLPPVQLRSQEAAAVVYLAMIPF